MKYDEHAPEAMDRSMAKSLWQDRALPELGKGGAEVLKRLADVREAIVPVGVGFFVGVKDVFGIEHIFHLAE